LQKNTPRSKKILNKVILATGGEALWRLCYHKAPGASPFNIAERIWLGALTYQEVRGLCKKGTKLEKAVRLKCLTDGIPGLVRLAINQETAIRDLSRFFGELQDYWNSLPVDSKENLKRVAQGSEIFPSCLLDFRCPQIPDLKSPWIEAFWGGFLSVQHRELAWRSPIHRAFVMERAGMKKADTSATRLKQELVQRSLRLKNALHIIHRYEASEECIEEALILAILSDAVELAELLDMVHQQEPVGSVLERLRSSASETKSHSLQKLRERVAKQKYGVNRLLIEASLQSVQEHISHPQRDTLALDKSRAATLDAQAARPSPAIVGHSSPSGEFHVFLAHNSYYKTKIASVARELQRRGLNPWLDKEQIPPGRWFQERIQCGINASKSAAIFIGRKGLGRWQAIELQTFVSRCVEQKIPVIPVLLPGCKDIPPELLFLKQLHCVRFVRRIDEVTALDMLEWGIRGEENQSKIAKS
jgi:hypothetical protein